jgi:hypothetical protein
LPLKLKDWTVLKRTLFERIARKINQTVTQRVLKKPYLIKDFLLIGQNEFENICYRHNISTTDKFIEILKTFNQQRPYSWISGKTLQAYWNMGNAKEKKLNVLLTFLDVSVDEWDEWKNPRQSPNTYDGQPPRHMNDSIYVLRKLFSGHYYRYFQKSDQSPVLVKAPFIIQEHDEQVVSARTKTLGHRYKSSYMVIRDGALYIECENMDWNEKESFIFNIGFESNPKVIVGVSNTLNRKSQAIALKNVLVRQSIPYDYKNEGVVEIPFDSLTDPDSIDFKLLSFFRNSRDNIITTSYCYSLEELEALGNYHTHV